MPPVPHTPPRRSRPPVATNLHMATPATPDQPNSHATINQPQTPVPRKHHNYALGHVLNNRIQITGIIGSGPYSVVYSAVDFFTGETLAVKMIPKRGSTTSLGQTLANQSDPALQTSDVQGLKRPRSMVSESYKHIEATSLSLDKVYQHYTHLVSTNRFKTRSPLHIAYREVALHSKAYEVSPSSVVKIMLVLDSAEFFYVVMEYFPAGDLFHAITDLKWYVGSDIRAKEIFTQLVSVVEKCHAASIYHCDLKPENVVVTQDGVTVKLTDFGLATSNAICLDYGCGSSFYMSPERLHRPTTNHPHGFSSIASDIWALGVILLNLTCGRNPWKKASVYEDVSYRAFVKDPRFLEKIMPVTPEFSHILARVFDLDPKRRLSLAKFHELVLACPNLTRGKSRTRAIPSPIKVAFYRAPSNLSTCSSGSTALGSPLHANQNQSPTHASHNHQTPALIQIHNGNNQSNVQFPKPTTPTPQLYPPISISSSPFHNGSQYNSPAFHSEGFDSPQLASGDICRSPSPYRTGLVPDSPGVPPLSPIPPRTSSITGLLPALPLRQPYHGGGHAHHHSGSFAALSHPYSRPSPRTPLRSPSSVANSPGARTLVDVPVANSTPFTPATRSTSISSLNMVYLYQGDGKKQKSMPSLPLAPSLH